MSRICLIAMGAVLYGCHGGSRPGRLPVVASDRIRETGAQVSAASTVETPRATTGPPDARIGVASTVGDTAGAKARGVAPRDVTQVLPELNSQMADAFFDYDRSALRPDAISVLRQDAAILLPILAEFPQLKVMVEGHCDERGSAEYNLGLGDHRARGVVEVLQGFGVPLANVEIISYGKERPQCTEPAESCWRLNRRAHLEVRAGGATE